MAIKQKIIPLVVLGLAGAGYFTYQKTHKAIFRYAGTLEATRIDIPARVATVIATIDVNEGEFVTAQQKVVSLACEELRISGKLASETFIRAEKLRRSEAMSQEMFDKIATQKQESDTRLRWCDVYTPIEGRVLTKYLEPGEWVNPGTKLLAIANLKDIWAYFYVPQDVMSRLKIGAAVDGFIPELGQKTFKGFIRKINSEAEFTPKNVQTQAERTRLVFGVKVAFENPTEALKPGMTIEVSLE